MSNTTKQMDFNEYVKSHNGLLRVGGRYLFTYKGRDIEFDVDLLEFENEDMPFALWALVPTVSGLPFQFDVIDATPMGEPRRAQWALRVFDKIDRKVHDFNLKELLDITGVDQCFAEIMADMGW